MNQLSLRNNMLKFKTSKTKYPSIVEESIQYMYLTSMKKPLKDHNM
jgi:hypothetical protein